MRAAIDSKLREDVLITNGIIKNIIGEAAHETLPLSKQTTEPAMWREIYKAVVIQKGGCVSARTEPGYICDMDLGLQLTAEICGKADLRRKCDSQNRMFVRPQKRRFYKMGDEYRVELRERR